MSALGNLVVKVALQYAEYTQGLDKSSQDAKKFAKGVQDAMDGAEKATANFFKGLVAGAVGAVAAAMSVQAVFGQINKAIGDLSNFQGVAEAIGSTAEKVSGLEEPLKRAGMGMTDLQAIGGKLSKALLDARDPASEAAKAFRSIGVDPKQFTDSTDALVAVSKAMVGFKDDTAKTQVAMQLLGKSGAETIGLMNELAEAQSLGATATLEQIRAADAFSKEVASIGVAFDQVGRAVAGGLLPSIHELISPIKDELQGAARGLSEWFKDNQKQVNEVFRAAAQVGGVLWDAVRAIAAAVGGTVAWSVETGVLAKGIMAVRVVLGVIGDGVNILAAMLARVGTTMYDMLVVPADAALAAFQTIAEFLGLGLAEKIAQTRQNMVSLFDGLKNYARNVVTDIGAGITYTNEALFGGPGLLDVSQRLRLAMGGATAAADGMRKSIVVLGKDSDEAAKAAQKLDENFDKLKQTLAEREAQLTAQLVSETKLTEVQKLEVKILADLASGALKVKAGKEEEIKAILKKLLALEKENAELDKNEEYLKKTAEENYKALEAQQARTQGLEEQVKVAAEEYSQIGLTKEQVVRLEVARLREAAASLRQIAAANQASDALQKQVEEFRKQADLMDRLADQKVANAAKQTQVDVAKATEDAWKKSADEISSSLTDALMRGFESGKGFLRNLIDTAKNLFQTLVLRPIIQAGVAPVAGAVQGFTSTAGAGLADMLGLGSNGVSLYSGWDKYGAAVANWFGLGSGTATSYAGSVLGLSSAAPGSQAAMLAAQTGQFGSAGLAATTAAGAGAVAPNAAYAAAAGDLYAVGGGTTAATAGMSWAAAAGWAAVIVAAIALLSRGGETRSGGQYGLRNGSAYLIEGPSGGDPNAAAAMRAIEETQATINNLVSGLGGSGAGQITRAGYEMSKYDYRRFSEIFVNGIGGRQYGIESNEAVGTAFAEDLKRGVLMGLQAAQLPQIYAEYLAKFNAFDLVGEQLDQVLDTMFAMKGLGESLARLGGVFQQFNAISIDSRMRIIELTGGLEAFNQTVADYVSNFYSEQEQAALKALQIQDALRAANVNGDWLNSREQFRWLVDSIDIRNQVGEGQFAGLMNVAADFAGISEFLRENNLTLGELAAQVPETTRWAAEMASANEIYAQQQQQAAQALGAAAESFNQSSETMLTVSQRIDMAAQRMQESVEQFRAIVERGASSEMAA